MAIHNGFLTPHGFFMDTFKDRNCIISVQQTTIKLNLGNHEQKLLDYAYASLFRDSVCPNWYRNN